MLLGLLGCLQLMLMDRGVADGAVTWYSTFIITQGKMPSCQAEITGKGTAWEQRCRSWAFLKGCSRGILSVLAATFTMNTYTSVLPFWPFNQQIYSYLHYFPAVHTSSNFKEIKDMQGKLAQISHSLYWYIYNNNSLSYRYVIMSFSCWTFLLLSPDLS